MFLILASHPLPLGTYSPSLDLGRGSTPTLLPFGPGVHLVQLSQHDGTVNNTPSVSPIGYEQPSTQLCQICHMTIMPRSHYAGLGTLAWSSCVS